MALTPAEQKELDELEYEQLMAESQGGAAPQKENKLDAALQGFGQGASFGYIPELQAATEPAMNWALEKLTGQKLPKDSNEENYDQRLKAAQARDQELQDNNTGAYMAGNVAGALSIPLPGASTGKATSAIGKIATVAGKAAGVGALTGGLTNVSQDTPSITKDPMANLKERGSNALRGAALGGIVGAGTESVSQGLQKIPDMAQKLKTYFAAKQMGLSGQSGKVEKLSSKLDDLSNVMGENGMMRPGKTTENVAEESKAILNKTGKEIGDTYKKIAAQAPGDAVSLSAKGIGEEIMMDAQARFASGDIDEPALKAVQNEVDRLAKHGDSIDEILRFRKSLDDRLQKIYNKPPSAELADKEEILLGMRQKVKGAMDQHINDIDKLNGSENSKVLKELNKRYGDMSEISTVASRAKAKNIANRLMNTGEVLTGIGAAGYRSSQGDDPVAAIGKGLATAAGLHAARKFGPGIAYQAASGAQKLAPKASRVVEKINPNKIALGAMTPWLKMKEEK